MRGFGAAFKEREQPAVPFPLGISNDAVGGPDVEALAASLNLIEPWWKTPRPLALAGRFFEAWERIEDTIEKAKDYWNAHRHPYARGRRRRRRTARRPGVGAMPTVPAVGG